MRVQTFWRFCASRGRCFRHFCSSRSTSLFGTAMTRLARFDNRSIGVLPGTVIFMCRPLCRTFTGSRDPFVFSPRGDCKRYMGDATSVGPSNVWKTHSRIAQDDRLSSERNEALVLAALPSVAFLCDVSFQRCSLRFEIPNRLFENIEASAHRQKVRTAFHASDSFCRVSIAAWISQHVSGSSLPVSAV
jgi:hypothetical protein